MLFYSVSQTITEKLGQLLSQTIGDQSVTTIDVPDALKHESFRSNGHVACRVTFSSEV